MIHRHGARQQKAAQENENYRVGETPKDVARLAHPQQDTERRPQQRGGGNGNGFGDPEGDDQHQHSRQAALLRGKTRRKEINRQCHHRPGQQADAPAPALKFLLRWGDPLQLAGLVHQVEEL